MNILLALFEPLPGGNSPVVVIREQSSIWSSAFSALIGAALPKPSR
jgi:hypothetical protein